MNTHAPHIERIEFWFDPVCPWAWLTSRWMTEVSQTIDHEVTWHPFSLAILNEGNADVHKESHQRGLSYGRMLTLVAEELGNEAVWKLYTALGTAIHHDQRTDEALLTDAVQSAGIDEALLAQAEQERERLEAALRESTNAGIAAVGPGVGIPIVAINGKAFFGPVVTPQPKGEDALRLWDAVVASTQTPGFYELKRGREVGPDLGNA